MRLDLALDDDAASTPLAAQPVKQQVLADIDIDAPSTMPAAAAASQGERLLKQMREKAAGLGHTIGAKTLLTKAAPVAKQVIVASSCCSRCIKFIYRRF
jgi:hypothetical protein